MQTEADFINVEQEEEEQKTSYTKPKKQLSEAQLQHLAVIREKALIKKKEMKMITEKANKLKELETLKVAKQLQKQELAKQYDEMINNQPKPVETTKPVEAPKQEEKKETPKEEVKPNVVKPDKKKKVIKKIIYQEASSSDSDGADEVEVVKVKKQHHRERSESKAPQKRKKHEPPSQSSVQPSYTNFNIRVKFRQNENCRVYAPLHRL